MPISLFTNQDPSFQIKNHLCAVLTHTDITIAVVMGGVAPQKQERLLRQGPDIVVGTPGRLWELIQQGNEHLSQLSTLKLVLKFLEKTLVFRFFAFINFFLPSTNLG